MARNDGIDRTVARNQDLETPEDVAKIQEHNEREKDSYSNQDIVPERTPLNVHFKAPTDDYVKMFEQMEQDKIISTRGLKPDAVKYGELVFDVNSAYFYNHGGYEFAKQFYADAYKATVEIVGGEQYILSAVMHADERNRAMSEALGEDVYHYHLHVVYIPVVEKQILWSKRCKDEALRGTVKETITQVSRSKKWDCKPVLDESGNPMINAKGKKILRSSYSVLQDDFFHFMRVAGYDDVERRERGSTEEHLTVTQFKVQAEQQRLEAVTGQVAQAEQSLADAKAATEKQKKKLEALKKETKAAKTVALTVQDIEAMGKNTLRLVRTEGLFTKLREISVTGFSTFFIDVAMGILTVLFNRQIMKYLGANALAIYGPIIQVSTFVQCCAYSVGQAAQPIISTNYGAGKGERIKETLHLALLTTVFFGVFWTGLSMACPNVYIRIFMAPTPEILDMAPAIIRTYALSFLLLPFNIFSTYYFQAIMKPRAAFIVSVSRGLVISGILIMLLPVVTGADSLWFAMPVTELAVMLYAVSAMGRYTKALHETAAARRA